MSRCSKGEAFERAEYSSPSLERLRFEPAAIPNKSFIEDGRMGAWGTGPFESDGGLDAAFDLLEHLAGKVGQVARGTGGDRSSLVKDQQELAANVELLLLVAEAVYRPAMFVPIRGLPLPDPDRIVGWREAFLARYARRAPKVFDATPAELEEFARQSAAPLDRLAEFSRQLAERAGATHQQVAAEVYDAIQRGSEAAG